MNKSQLTKEAQEIIRLENRIKLLDRNLMQHHTVIEILQRAGRFSEDQLQAAWRLLNAE